MDNRPGVISRLRSLTVPDGLVTVNYGWPVWMAWSGDRWSRGLLLMMAVMAATSLANLWNQALQPSANPRGGGDV